MHPSGFSNWLSEELGGNFWFAVLMILSGLLAVFVVRAALPFLGLRPPPPPHTIEEYIKGVYLFFPRDVDGRAARKYILFSAGLSLGVFLVIFYSLIYLIDWISTAA